MMMGDENCIRVDCWLPPEIYNELKNRGSNVSEYLRNLAIVRHIENRKSRVCYNAEHAAGPDQFNYTMRALDDLGCRAGGLPRV